EALVQAMAGPVKDVITCGFEVTSLRKAGSAWEIGDGSRTVTADRVICTVPLQNLFGALTGVPPGVREAVDALHYNSVCSVFVGVRGNVPDISWLYVPDPDLGFMNRVSFPSNYSRDVVPEGCGSILAEITYNEGDPVSGMSDREIIAHVVGSLEKMDLVRSGNIVYTGLDRHRFAYVVYDLRYLETIAVVRDYCRSIGIDLVGRFAQFEYLNMDGCIRSVMDYTGWSG
ncbi:MAG: FAD-dependent oxidoreductase, partial [Methanomicrobiales archaeon]|nr:FAD-dependent oxidoreductase [Methanomicrobiales archaeon]